MTGLDASGSEDTVTLPGTTVPVPARTTRDTSGGLAFAFRQEPAALAEVDMALAVIGGAQTLRAA